MTSILGPAYRCPRDQSRTLPTSWDRVPFKRKTCAVVSSGSGLLHRGLGPRVDSFQSVWRANNPRIRGFEKDVGSRTDVHILGTYWAKYLAEGGDVPATGHFKWMDLRDRVRRGEVGELARDENLILIFDDMYDNTQKWMCDTNDDFKASESWTVFNLIEQGTTNSFHFAVSHWWRQEGRYEESAVSTGMVTILLAAAACDTLHLSSSGSTTTLARTIVSVAT